VACTLVRSRESGIRVLQSINVEYHAKPPTVCCGWCSPAATPCLEMMAEPRTTPHNLFALTLSRQRSSSEGRAPGRRSAADSYRLSRLYYPSEPDCRQISSFFVFCSRTARQHSLLSCRVESIQVRERPSCRERLQNSAASTVTSINVALLVVVLSLES